MPRHFNIKAENRRNTYWSQITLCQPLINACPCFKNERIQPRASVHQFSKLFLLWRITYCFPFLHPPQCLPCSSYSPDSKRTAYRCLSMLSHSACLLLGKCKENILFSKTSRHYTLSVACIQLDTLGSHKSATQLKYFTTQICTNACIMFTHTRISACE